VFGGGLIGAGGRDLVSHLLAGGLFPVPTLIVNLVGSLLLGFYLARRARVRTPRWSLQFWAIGVFGSLTTFSTFSLEVVRLLETDRLIAAAGYVGVSLIGGLAFAVAGYRAGSGVRT
jgi:CrcB protein